MSKDRRPTIQTKLEEQIAALSESLSPGIKERSQRSSSRFNPDSPLLRAERTSPYPQVIIEPETASKEDDPDE